MFETLEYSSSERIGIYSLVVDTLGEAYGHVGVAGASLGIGGGEDGVDKHKSPDDFGTEAISLGVAVGDNVGATTVFLIERWLEGLHDTGSADGAKALHDHVVQEARQAHLARQEQAPCHRRVDVPT